MALLGQNGGAATCVHDAPADLRQELKENEVIEDRALVYRTEALLVPGLAACDAAPSRFPTPLSATRRSLLALEALSNVQQSSGGASPVGQCSYLS